MQVNGKNDRHNGAGCRPRRWLTAGCVVFILLLLLAGVIVPRALRRAPTTLLPFPAPSPTVTAAPQDEESATPTPIESAEPQLPGRIVFVNPQGQIGTVGPGGQDSRLLTGEGRRFIFPAWSPDGKVVAAIGGDAEESGVYTAPDTAAAEVATLYASDEFSPIYLYWSPDGRQVSFIAQTEEALGLHLAPAAGGGDSRLLFTGQPFYWHWLAGSQQVLIHTNGSAPDARLALLNVDDARPEEDLGQSGYFQAPVISAGEEYVAFAELGAGNDRRIVIQNRNKEVIQQLPHFGVAALGWSPADDVLAYISPMPTEQQSHLNFYGPLRLVDAETGEVATLASGVVIAFFWSPDGRSIAYFTVAGSASEFNASLSGDGRFVRRSKGHRQDGPPRLSLWVADVESDQSQLLLTFQPSTVFLRQFLPFFDQYALSHDLWSPDGRALVLPLVEAETVRLYVIPINRQEIWPVAEGSVGFWSRR